MMETKQFFDEPDLQLLRLEIPDEYIKEYQENSMQTNP